MSKLRYIAPVVAVATTVSGASLIPSGQALANTKHDTCDFLTETICLYYSAGTDSSVWRDAYGIAYPDFTSDTADGQHKAEYDEFTGGTGSGKGVRNDAHSEANPTSALSDYLCSLPDLEGDVWPLAPFTSVAVTISNGSVHKYENLRNNNASFFASESPNP